MKFIIASLFVIAAVHALPINNLQVELTPVEIAATYTADANAALKSCQGWFDSVCSDSLKKITNKFASQKITDCNSVDLEAAALAQKRLSTCAKRWLVSSCKEDVEGLVQDMIALGASRVRAKAEADKAVVRTAGIAWRFADVNGFCLLACLFSLQLLRPGDSKPLAEVRKTTSFEARLLAIGCRLPCA